MLRPGLAFAGGALWALAFAPWGQSWLAWLGPAVLLALTQDQPGRGVFRTGWLFGLGWHLVSLHWLLQIPWPGPAILAWLGLSAVLSFYPAAWIRFCRFTSPRKPDGAGKTSWARRAGWTLLGAAAWVALEMIRSRFLTGFGWNLLGVSQEQQLSLIQMAAWTGVYGISFLVVWLGLAIGLAWEQFRTHHCGRRIAQEIIFPFLTILLLAAGGAWRRQHLPAPARTVRLALIQPAIPQLTLWNPAEKNRRLEALLGLSRTALAEKPDLLVWPEAALPDVIARSRSLQETITGLVRSQSVWMIFGGQDLGRRPMPDGQETTDYFNTAFLVDPAGDLRARYHKQHLVPFGEYLPLGRAWPFLQRFRTGGAGLMPGWQPVKFALPVLGLNIGPLICFEDVFPHLTRQQAGEDTDILLNLTNNGWFGEGAAQWQHLANARFRAVENGLPLVACANNGLTCWVDATGGAHDVYFPASANVYQSGVKIVSVPVGNASRTFYRQHGDWFGWGCCGITVVGLLATVRRRQQKT